MLLVLYVLSSVHTKEANLLSHLLKSKRLLCVSIGPSVNPLQNSETQHVNIVLQYMYQFFEQPNMKRNYA